MLVFPSFRLASKTDFTPDQYSKFGFNHIQFVGEWDVINQHLKGDERNYVAKRWRKSLKYLSPDYGSVTNNTDGSPTDWVNYYIKNNNRAPILIDVEMEDHELYERIAKNQNRFLPGINWSFWGYAPDPFTTNRIWFKQMYDQWNYLSRSQVTRTLKEQKPVADRMGFSTVVAYALAGRVNREFDLNKFEQSYYYWLNDSAELVRSIYHRPVYVCISPQPHPGAERTYYRKNGLLFGGDYFNEDVWCAQLRVVQSLYKAGVIQGCICWQMYATDFGISDDWLQSLIDLANDNPIELGFSH